MGRMSPEQKFADKMHEYLIREDFDTSRAASFVHRLGIRLQVKVFKVFTSLIGHWAIDYDNGAHDEFPDEKEYTNLLMYSKRISETLWY